MKSIHRQQNFKSCTLFNGLMDLKLFYRERLLFASCFIVSFCEKKYSTHNDVKCFDSEIENVAMKSSKKGETRHLTCCTVLDALN